MFDIMINSQNKILGIVTEEPSSQLKRQNMYYVEMSLLEGFFEDYIDLENYIRHVFDARYTNLTMNL